MYGAFGVDAELLIDHAFGIEPVTIADIKHYKPKNNSISSGQILACDYNFKDGKLIVKEMSDMVSLELLSQNLVTGSITLHVGYAYDYHLKPAHGTVTLDMETNSDSIIIPAVTGLYEKIVAPDKPIRRINITCNHVKPEEYRQYTFFYRYGKIRKKPSVTKSGTEN